MMVLYVLIIIAIFLYVISLVASLADERLRVLMYHKVSAGDKKDFLTITTHDLEAQFHYLQQKGYTPILFSDLVSYIASRKALPAKPVLITFDDGYRDNLTNMYPLLAKYNMKANIFLVASWVRAGEQAAGPVTTEEEYLSVADINAMDPTQVEFGLHSLDHKSYAELSTEEVNVDIAGSKALLKAKEVSFQPCLAFPYGAYPKRNTRKQWNFFDVLAANQLALAFRIGNRLNLLPLRNPLLVQRLDIRGDESFQKFTRLLKHGKRPFS